MTLTNAAVLTKKLMLFAGIVLILSFSGWIGYRYYYYNIYLPSLPPPEEKPDVKFGKLPFPLFPESSASASNYQYVLDTQTGDLPAGTPKILKVFFIPQRSVSLLDPDRSLSLAESLGFPIGPQIITPTLSQYTDGQVGSLSIDLNTGNLAFVRNLTATASAGTLPSVAKLESEFKSYLRKSNLFKPDLEGGRMSTLYNNGILRESTNATVSIWQENIEDIPIVTPLFKFSLVRELVKSGKTDKEKILSLNYTYWQIDKNTFATYPLRSISSAFRDLKDNKGVVIFAPNTSSVSLRNIYLGYYLPENYTPYLQPVYVFEGENFAAFVPAILSDYVEEF